MPFASASFVRVLLQSYSVGREWRRQSVSQNSISNLRDWNDPGLKKLYIVYGDSSK